MTQFTGKNLYFYFIFLLNSVTRRCPAAGDILPAEEVPHLQPQARDDTEGGHRGAEGRAGEEGRADQEALREAREVEGDVG